MTAQLRIARTNFIAAPMAQLWALLTDFAAYGDWNPYSVRIDGPPVTLTLLTVHAVMRPGHPQLVQPLARRHGRPQQFCRRPSFHPARITGGTRLGQHEEFSGSAAAAILANFGPAIRANLNGLMRR
jgi:hypothetical protein